MMTSPFCVATVQSSLQDPNTQQQQQQNYNYNSKRRRRLFLLVVSSRIEKRPSSCIVVAKQQQQLTNAMERFYLSLLQPLQKFTFFSRLQLASQLACQSVSQRQTFALPSGCALFAWHRSQRPKDAGCFFMAPATKKQSQQQQQQQ